MGRLTRLREDMLKTKHGNSRIVLSKEWTTKELPYSLAERKAMAIKMIFDTMPLYIGEDELIVGTRTVYGELDKDDHSNSTSNFNYNAMPSYVNEADVNYFGFNHEFVSKAHYAPDYSVVMDIGIDGLLHKIDLEQAQYTLNDQVEFGHSVRIVYQGLKCLIVRYSTYASEEAEKYEGARKAELLEIAEICMKISSKPAGNLREASQLFWFLYLATIIENFQFINFGRIDQLLFPYVQNESEDVLTELMGALLLKMYDQYDLVLADKNLMGRYSAQHNVTIGGMKRDGTDGCNAITKAVLTALSTTNLPEPLISVRVADEAPKWLMTMASQLSVNGMNCMAYYNDALVIDSLNNTGIDIENARDYGFGLCQDVLIPGRGDHYCSGGVNLTFILLRTMEALKDQSVNYEEFMTAYKDNITAEIDKNLVAYNDWEYAILEYNKGNRTVYFDYLKEGRISADEPSLGLNDAQAAKSENEDVGSELYIQTLMSPLPVTSALYRGCIETGTDVTRFGCELKDKGVMILGPVVAVNGLVALKKIVFEEQRYSLKEVWVAMQTNWEDHEVMRQYLWNTVKWCNDDDFVDEDAVELITLASERINTFKTPGGGTHLAGVHQPHPVFAGRHIPATPEGRFSGAPIPVTLSPENGTLKDGPSAAMKSVAKIDSRRIQWNSCLMLQYYSTTFGEHEGAEKFASLLKAYFKLGGIQHQPNVVDMDELKDAQIHPEEHKDIIIRMWGVSAHFVDLPRDVQEEFISRYDN